MDITELEKPKKNVSVKKVIASRISKESLKQLRLYALENDTSTQEIMIEALRLWFDSKNVTPNPIDEYEND